MPSPTTAPTTGPGRHVVTEFVDSDLRGARFVRADLSGVVMRGVNLSDAHLDDPLLTDSPSTLWVNGVDVAPYVEAELNRRFPGRAQRRASGPDGLRAAWAAAGETWASTLDRAARMPTGSVEISVRGEWSLAQTLRHLVMATDIWLRRAVLRERQPYDPVGLPHAEYELDGLNMAVFATPPAPSYEQVLEARSAHLSMVRGFIATVTAGQLTEQCTNPWSPGSTMTTLSCLHVILQEEWEHHRCAVRDLDAIEAGPGR